ncbi:MAG: succinate dehydrogenase, hydrophobic membrane anchor protein [bacterium]
MKVVEVIPSLLKNAFLNKFPGMGSFWIQRVTGVILALYLIPHIIIISTAKLFSGATFSQVIGWMHSPIVWILELSMILGLAFHMLNGLRIILVDFFSLSRKQQQMLWAASLGCFAIVGISIVLYLPKFINFFADHAF